MAFASNRHKAIIAHDIILLRQASKKAYMFSQYMVRVM